MNVRKSLKVLLYCCAGLAALLLAGVLAVTIALNRVPEYQTEIKDWVHRQTGYNIRFARVAPAFHWYGPGLYFAQLELRSKDDRRVLARAASGRIAVDLSQLFRGGKLFGKNGTRCAEHRDHALRAGSFRIGLRDRTRRRGFLHCDADAG